MQELLQDLQAADYAFLSGVIESPLNLSNDQKLNGLIAAWEEDATPEKHQALNEHLEKEIRYLGSSEALYWSRWMFGQEPGTSFHTIIKDAAKVLKVDVPAAGTQKEQVEALVTGYVTKQFQDLTQAEQQELLESLGVDKDRAASFLKRSAGVFALPLMVEAFGSLVVDALIKKIIFGAIAKIIGKQLANRLFQFIAGRFPWWVAWIGPAIWSVSIGWTMFDLQGPAMRKTIPITLYLGLCSMRDASEA